MNDLQLKAQRQALGLTVAEACELVKNKDGQPLSKRMWQYMEQGERSIPEDVDIAIFGLASRYTLLLDRLTADIIKLKQGNTESPALPFWHSFEQFKADTGNPSQAHWKIWQAVIGHLMLKGELNYLDDSAKVPAESGAWQWLKGDYGVML